MRKQAVALIAILLMVIVLALAGCNQEHLPAVQQATPTPTPWYPNYSKLLIMSREYLRPGSEVSILVPPADYRIVPVSVGKLEQLVSWGFNVNENTESYIDAWLVDSEGNVIVESGRTFNYGCRLSLSEGTYYIYLSNEFTSAHDKRVHLSVVWQ